MQAAANELRSLVTHLQLHTGDPGASGTSNLTSAGRQAVTWSSPASDGDFGLSATITFTGVAASGTATYVSTWSASSGGTTYGNFLLTGDTAANAAGEYKLNTLNVNFSAT